MPGIDYTLGLKAAGFKSGVGDAMGELKKLGGAAAALTATAGLAAGVALTATAALTAGAALTAAAGVGIGASILKGINAAAQRESLEAAFAPMLGSMEKARERMREISDFSNITPFEPDEVAAANRTLESMTRGALANAEAMTMIGDASAQAKIGYQDMAKYVGQLYTGLQKGGTFGESLEILPQLGIISPQVKQQLQAMKAAGEPFKKMWAVVRQELGKTAGAMEIASMTWEGKMSTAKGLWKDLWVEFGKPILDQVKPFLDSAIEKLKEMRETASDIGTRVGEVFGTLRKSFEQGNTFKLIGAQLRVAFAEALNFLGKGLNSVFAGIKEMIDTSGIEGALRALADAIGQAITTAILSGLEKVFFSGINAEDVNASRERANERFAAARDSLNTNVDQIAQQGFKAMQSAWKNSPDLQMVADAKANYEAVAGPLRDAALADIEAREKALEEKLAEIARRKAEAEAAAGLATGGAAAKLPQPLGGGIAGGGPNWLERLGFLGGGVNPRTSNAAERQAALAQRQISILSRIESLLATREPEAATF